MSSKPKALFVCGSLNQTTQMHAIARELDDFEPWFTPYYVDGVLEICRRAHLLDITIAGHPWSAKCSAYLKEHGLPVDYRGERFDRDYRLVVTCQDAFMPRNIFPGRGKKVVLVQEGMTDPENFAYRLVRRFPFLPRWISSTAATGLSDGYHRFCVASEGYREFFAKKGCNPSKIVVTGIPNFDDMERYRNNTVALRGYVLACTSDARETLKFDDRQAFLRHVVAIAAGRPLVFKLHPNEKWARSEREIKAIAPSALVLTSGCAEEMVANCEVLIVQYSTLAFVGLALGKEVHSYYSLDELRRLLPWQNGGLAARNIAGVCREVVGLDAPKPSRRSEVTESPQSFYAREILP